MSQWNALKRFAGSLIIGDVAGAATVLQEQPDVPKPPETKEDDPPCKRTDGDKVCLGHGIGGMCIFGDAAPPTPKNDK